MFYLLLFLKNYFIVIQLELSAFSPHWNIFLKDFIYLFLEKRKGRKRGGETSTWERNINPLSLPMPPTQDLACNPSIFLDQESNQWPFGLQDNIQPTELHQSWQEEH